MAGSLLALILTFGACGADPPTKAPRLVQVQSTLVRLAAADETLQRYADEATTWIATHPACLEYYEGLPDWPLDGPLIARVDLETPWPLEHGAWGWVTCTSPDEFWISLNLIELGSAYDNLRTIFHEIGHLASCSLYPADDEKPKRREREIDALQALAVGAELACLPSDRSSAGSDSAASY